MSKELHEHEHEHHHHDHGDDCGCCCDHDHEDHEHHHHDHEDNCCCGHDHDHEHEDHEHHHSHDHDFDHIAKDKQRIYIIEGLDCANCAAKIETAVKALPGVKNASVSFMQQSSFALQQMIRKAWCLSWKKPVKLSKMK